MTGNLYDRIDEEQPEITLENLGQNRPQVNRSSRLELTQQVGKVVNSQIGKFDNLSIEAIQNIQNDTEDLPVYGRTALRLEKGYEADLERLCREHKITGDTFVEGALMLCNSDPAVMAAVLKTAKAHYRRRKEASEKRRLKTLNEKYASPQEKG
jgi:hypothetical protein